MSPDLHPEELFDKAARGELSPAEQGLLDAHLAQCSVCRFEHQVAADFAAVPMPSLNIDKLVSNALLARSTENLRRRPSRKYGTLLAAAVALMAVGSFAAVGQWTGVLPRLISAITAPSSAPRVEPVKTSARTGAQPSAPRAVAERADDEISAPPVIEAPPPPPPQPLAEERPAERVELRPFAPSRALPSPSRVAVAAVSAPARVIEPTPTPAPVSPPAVEAPATPEIPRQVVASAAELFAAANRARLEGDRPFAMARYQQLLSTWPRSAEAVQTQATLGRLLLDQGAPAAALEHLDAYLASGDATLKEDVLSARAQTLMRLGRGVEEGRTWRELVERYPSSIHAPRARERLQTLAATP